MVLLVRRAVSLFLITLITPVLVAQENRYMVFFTDKNNSSYSINDPGEFLSARALARRTKHEVAIELSDLPVNGNYADSVQRLGARTYFTTKWMNGVLVEMDEMLVPTIEAVSFVDRVELVAPGTQLLDRELDRGAADPPIIVTPDAEVRTDFQNEMVGVDEMHAAGFRGAGVMIAVFDSGFPNLSRIDAFSHLFEDSRIVMCKDWTFNQEYVESGHVHGLRVLSVMAGQRADFIGTAPEASYLLFITEDGRSGVEYRVEEYNWLFAAEAADSAGVDLISTSVGYSLFEEPSRDYSYADMNGRSAIISQAAGWAYERGIVVLTSAGNEGNRDWQYITAPADHPDVLAIGAVNSALNKTSVSSIGPNIDGVLKPDLVAFGSATSTINGSGAIQLGNGTSYAAPIVTGLVAGLMEAMPELKNDQITNIIRASGHQAISPDNDRGYGIPHFTLAVDIASRPTVEVDEGILVFPNPSGQNVIFLSFGAENFDIAHVIEIFSSDGSLLNTIRATPSLIKSSVEIDWSLNAPGMYLLRVTNSNQRLTRKLIKY